MIAIGLSRPSRTRTVDWANIGRLAAFRVANLESMGGVGMAATGLHFGWLRRVPLAMALLALAGCHTAPMNVDSARLIADELDGRNWAAYGRTYSEHHASPLRQIDRRNVEELGLAWSLDLPGVTNGATVPLAIDGIIYLTVGQSIVHAVDARTGRLLWRHDPEVTKVAKRKLRITWGPRGIGYWEGKIYVGTTD